MISRNIYNISTNKLLVLASLMLVAIYNISFFSHVVEVYPLNTKNIGFVASLAPFLGSIIILLLMPFSSRYTIKPALVLVFLLSSLAAYFMDSYNVIIDDGMIENIVGTDIDESADLLSLKLLGYFLLLGVLPAYLVIKARINYAPLKKELLARIVTTLVAIVVLVVVVLSFSKFYASFFREHKPLRYYANPVFYVYSAGKYIKNTVMAGPHELQAVGRDARIPLTDKDRELIILVIGETVRADRFSLNGYNRKTNPLLEKEDVISFSNVLACGTSTAESVPCMFSVLNKNDYSIAKAVERENLLDVLKHAGVNILWRDNNSSSKGVADRVTYESYKHADKNTICNPECRDEGMLVGLQDYINKNTSGDIFIVLHQMGNHGPAYYKRYPKSFEKFKPVCATNQLEDCSVEEINNAYDNAILYTDDFLKKVIDLLKTNNHGFETAMLYVSDHGESLGENGIYLHGMPYLFAPGAQIHVPAILWVGDSYDEIDMSRVRERQNEQFSHDNLFHTILGLMEIQSTAYDKNLDIVPRTATSTARVP
ncbi:phosphoethanolamine transferase [Sulfuriflexus mobilis]|uniref:phosphoethanolamine transferase n=1 Tax=Sulfuriflexus mobilis TaxID=1811807 RepID=UPI000F834F24|nr:phosphoethanolamine--lipid A transferase [Sulfuriflexus mobilis]